MSINSVFKGLHLSLNSSKIAQISYTKSRVRIIDNKLKWNLQIDHIKNKISKTTGILYRCRKINNKTMINLYYTLFYPYIIYGIKLW